MKVIVPIEFLNLTVKEKIVYKKKTIKTSCIIHLMNYCFYYKDEDQFSLNAKMMRFLYRTNYNLIVSYLIDKDFIKKVKSHSAGRWSTQYQVIFPFTVFTDPFDLKNTFLENKWKAHQRNQILSLDSVQTSILPELRKPLIDNLYKVNIDAIKAYNWLINNVTDPVPLALNTLRVESIYLKELQFSFDPYGRFHTSFTNLKKELRQYLQVNGKQLLEFDIKTCQPLLLAQILKQHNHFNIYDRYIDITENQDIYLHLLGKNPQYNRETLKDSRKAIKNEIFKALFDSERKTTQIPYNKLLNDEFPEVYTFVKHYKKNHGEYLWMTLQRLESNFIFNNIFKSIHEMNLFCITIHDSIFVEKKDQRIIDCIWHEGLEKLKNSYKQYKPYK